MVITWRPDFHATSPTQRICAATVRINSAAGQTHHLVTLYRVRGGKHTGELVCIHCGKTEKQLREETP